MKKNGIRTGFTLIELIVVVSILAILAGVLVPRVSDHMASARDARRLADVKSLQAAIEQFKMDKGHYPRADQSGSHGGWDVTHDGQFISELVKKGYLEEPVADPTNDDTFHYRYYVYNQGSSGCGGDGRFYVLGVRNFESRDFSKKHKGFFRCSGRDWGSEFAYVTGGGATFK
jgi:general secretion pathway protein G